AQVLKLTEAFVRQDQLTTLMVTHSMDQALGMGHRTLLMNKGRIEEDLEGSSRSSLTTQDFLDKFARIRRLELLTPEMIRTFQAEYR
ncbi:MAG TPA: hypothetical protein VN436_00995, partial [Holophaga sp.]|nr:hypothetical protein [Holophaga sp.]